MSEIREPAPGVPGGTFDEAIVRARAVEPDSACPACRLWVQVVGHACDEHRWGAALAFMYRAGYGQGRDDEAAGADLPAWLAD